VFPVAIRRRETDEKVVTAKMSEMREWLDHRRFEPSTFRYAFEAPGLVFQVDFKMQAEAIALPERLAGK